MKCEDCQLLDETKRSIPHEHEPIAEAQTLEQSGRCHPSGNNPLHQPPCRRSPRSSAMRRDFTICSTPVSDEGFRHILDLGNTVFPPIPDTVARPPMSFGSPRRRGRAGSPLRRINRIVAELVRRFGVNRDGRALAGRSSGEPSAGSSAARPTVRLAVEDVEDQPDRLHVAVKREPSDLDHEPVEHPVCALSGPVIIETT